jgi:hypothetical protein
MSEAGYFIKQRSLMCETLGLIPSTITEEEEEGQEEEEEEEI